jgi:hypothetical protein
VFDRAKTVVAYSCGDLEYPILERGATGMMVLKYEESLERKALLDALRI